MNAVPKGLRGHLPGPVHQDAVPAPAHVHCEALGPMVPLVSDSPAQWVAATGMILRVLAGSGVHGMAIEGTDDRDEMGVFIEPPEYVIGARRIKHYTYRSQPEGVCSGPGDLDLVAYGLRRYIGLASRGNPTVLLPLFVDDADVCFVNDLGRELRANREMFLSRQAGARFRGYLESQRRGLLGLRSGGTRNQGRHDIRAKYGFDCYLDDTEFLTRDGWKTYDQIHDGQPVATINQSTGAVEFQVPSERVAKSYDGPIHYFRHRYTDCAVTPNHRMWSSPVNRGPSGRIGNRYRPEVADWRFRPASELIGIHHTRVVGAPRETEYPVDDATLNLVGCFLSEGTVAKRSGPNGAASVLSFTQQVGGRLETALAAASALHPIRSFGPYVREDGDRTRPCEYRVYTFADRQLAARMEAECGTGSRSKRLPAWAFDLSARQAEVLLTALMAGDGTRTRGGWQIYYSISRQLAGDVQALAVIAGRRANMWGPYAKDMYQVMVQDPGREFEAVSMRNNHRVEHANGARIVCFTVPNETLVTRRNGRVAMHGNTKFAAHMVRLGLQGVELLSTGSITLPVPEPDRTWLRELKQGRHTKEEALDRALELEGRLERLMVTSPLPERPDHDAINRWLVDTHRRYWKWT